MGSKNVFSAWFKELCSLIFVQSFQAFLLAILMSIIITALGSSDLSQDGGVDGAGLLCIIALASFSKMELLIKNIFGLTSGQGDPSLAAGKRGLTAGGLIAMRLGGRVLDNGGKIIGGLGRAIKGEVRTIKARNDYRDAFGAANAPDGDGDASNRTITGYRGTIGALNGGGSGIAGDSISISKLASELSKLNENISEQNNINKKKNNEKDKNDKLDKLKSAIDDAKKERDEGLKSIASGVVETIGAAHGAIAGAVIGAATGENIAGTTASGAGIGDTIGQKTVNYITATPKINNTIVTGTKEIGKSIKNRDLYSQIDRDIAKQNSEKLDKLQQKLDLYAKQGKGNDTRSSNSSSTNNIRTRKPKSLDNEQ